MKKSKWIGILFSLTAGLPFISFSEIKLPAVIGNHMVLQQNSRVPLWGEATPDKEIKIRTSWDRQEYRTRSDRQGKWKTEIVTPGYGGPYTLTLSDGKTLKLDQVMIGEVWLCSGQSNMEMPLAGWGKINNYEQEIAAADYPDIRLFQVERSTAFAPQSDCYSSGWKPCSPQSVPNFSAAAYFFAKNLYEKYHIPIGLIHTSWGGTPAESWTSAEALKEMPALRQGAENIEKLALQQTPAPIGYEKARQEWEKKLQAADRGFGQWMKPCYNDSGWKEMQVPGVWEKQGLEKFDGVVWFRKTVHLPASWKKKNLNLYLDDIDDDDITYFNGKEIGRNRYGNSRCYTVPAQWVKEGDNVITVRIYDSGGDGGFCGKAANLKLEAPDALPLSLAGSWKYRPGVDIADLPEAPLHPGDPYRPSVLFNAMVHPLVPYTIRGVLWYQGEANTWRSYQYRELLPLMIRDWRKRWNSDFPFYIVQISAFMDRNQEPGESDWAELREAQLKTLNLENTALAVTIDIGDAKDIHPKNKQEVGRRLSLIARNRAYGENIEYSGPLYESCRLEGDTIRIRFSHAASGLATPGNTPVTGFTIAGSDHRFYYAEAKIEGEEIIVYHPQVRHPVAVRYAWANNPECNLYNKAGLPASPFRTDDWDGLTRNNR